MKKGLIPEGVIRLWSWAFGGVDFYHAIVLLFPALGGVVTAWLSALGHVPPYLIALYSLGAICFCVLSVAGVHYVVRYRAVFERMRYVGTEPLLVNLNPDQNTVGVIFKCKLMNMSQTRSIYVALRRGDAHLQGRTNPDPILKDEIVIVTPFSDFAITTAAVPDINVLQEIEGKLEVEISYGPSPRDLRYLLTYEIKPKLDIRDLTEKGAQIFFTGPVKKYEHKTAHV